MYQYSKFMITFVAVSLLVIYLVLKQMPRLRSLEKFRSSTMQIGPTEKSGLKCYVEGLKLSKLVLFYSGTIHLFPHIRSERKVVSTVGGFLSFRLHAIVSNSEETFMERLCTCTRPTTHNIIHTHTQIHPY